MENMQAIGVDPFAPPRRGSAREGDLFYNPKKREAIEHLFGSTSTGKRHASPQTAEPTPPGQGLLGAPKQPPAEYRGPLAPRPEPSHLAAPR